MKKRRNGSRGNSCFWPLTIAYSNDDKQRVNENINEDGRASMNQGEPVNIMQDEPYTHELDIDTKDN